MRLIWLISILLILASCGEKGLESSPLSSTPVGNPPLVTDQDQTDSGSSVSIFETEEFKKSLALIELKRSVLKSRGYKIYKNEDGGYIWESYTYKNELGAAEVKWQEGWFVTKYRTKIGGPTHDLVTGEELSVFSDSISLYHTQPVYEFLSIKNWPILEKYLGEYQDAIVAHYNKYMNDFSEETKKNLEGQFSLVDVSYKNAKSHIEYLSLPVMTWTEILEKYGKNTTVFVDDKNLNLISVLPELINNSEIGRQLKQEGKVIGLKNKPDDYFSSDKKFKVYSNIITLIQ